MNRKKIRKRLRRKALMARARHNAIQRPKTMVDTHDKGYYIGLAHGFEQALELLREEKE